MKVDTMQKVILSMLMLSAASVFANEAADDQANRAVFAGGQTRAEVKAEYLRAKTGGTLADTSEAASLQPITPQGNGRSRAEARAEAVQAARTRVIHELI